MTSSPYASLSTFQLLGFFQDIETENALTKLYFEVKTIRRKLMVLPTARESEALPDLIFTRKLAEFLDNTDLPKFDAQIESTSKLQEILFEDYLQGVCSDIIKARVYNNKEIIKIADGIFIHLISYCTKKLSTENAYYYNIINTILDKSVDYYTINGKEWNLFEWAFGDLLKVPEESAEFLKTLKKGDFVDCWKSQAYQKSWSRATYEGYETGLARIRFFGDVNVTFLNTPIFEIAKLGTKSIDFEWRENLQVGDLVDYYHYKINWALYRVVKVTSDENMYGEILKSVQLQKENTEKSELENDSHKKKTNLTINLGFTSNEYFDDFSQICPVRVHSTALAKPHTNSSKRDIAINDSEDVVFMDLVDTKKYAILRPGSGSGSNSIYFIKYVNVFGAKKGFEFLVNVASQKILVKPETMVLLIQMIQNFSESMVGPFVKEHGKVLLEWLISYIENNIEKRIRTFTQANLGNFIDAVAVFTKRIWTNSESTRKTNELIMNIGVTCLRSEILEKQFFGAKKIIEIEEKIRHEDPDRLRSKVADLLIQAQIYEKIIKGHPNLIEKASGILKILFDENRIDDEQLSSLWNQICKADSESRSALIGMIKSISWHMSQTQTCFFLTKMIQNIDDISPEILEMISSLRLVASNKHKDQQLVNLLNDLLWKLFQSDKETRPEVSKELLSTLVKNIKADSIELYFNRTVKNMTSGIHKNKSFKLFIKLLKEPACLDEKIVKIMCDYKIVDFCISEIKNQLQQTSQQNPKIESKNTFQENQIITETNNLGSISEFEPSNQKSTFQDEKIPIEKIFKFFTILLKSVVPLLEPNIFTFDHFAIVFKEIIKANCQRKNVHDWLFNFLREEKKTTEVETYKKFFLENLNELLGEEGHNILKFFVVLFFTINEIDKKLINKRVKLESPVNSYKFSSKNIFISQTLFEEMFGASDFWRIFLTSTNVKLYRQLGNFISNFNLQPDFAYNENQALYNQLKSDLFKKAYKLFLGSDQIQADKACILLNRIIKNEEFNQGSGIVSFGQLKEGEKISLFVVNDQKYTRDKVRFQVYPSETVYQLKEAIVNDFKIPFESCALFRENGDEINYIDNISTVETAGIKQCDTLLVKDREIPEVEYEFFDNEGNFSDSLKKVFHEIFIQVAKKERISLDSMKSILMKMCTESSYDMRKSLLSAYFQKNDVDNNEHISEQAFLDYFKEIALASERGSVLIKQYLSNLGYVRTFFLKRFSIADASVDRSIFTRYQLAIDPVFYEKMLKCVSSWCSSFAPNEINYSQPKTDAEISEFDVSMEHCLKLFDLLSPFKCHIEQAINDPVKFISDVENGVIFSYKLNILSALLFRQEFGSSLLNFGINYDENTSFEIMKKIVSAEFLNIFFEKIQLTANMTSGDSHYFWQLCSPLKLLEKILKITIILEDESFLHSAKNVTQHFMRKNKKQFEKVGQNENKIGPSENFSKNAQSQAKIGDKSADDLALLKFQTLFTDCHLAEIVKNNLDFLKLNQILMQLFKNLNSKQIEINANDRCVLKTLMILFVSSVKLKESELVNILSQEDYKQTIISCLTSEKNLIRHFFKNLYSIWSSETKDLAIKTVLFKILISTLSSDKKDDFHSLVELSCSILAEIGEIKSQNPITEKHLYEELDFMELFNRFKNLLFSHKSQENQFDDTEDTLQISYLAFLEKIAKADDSISSQMNKQDKNELIGFIFKECLFVIKENNLLLNQARCKSKRSRFHAFELLKQLLKSDSKQIIYFLATCINSLSKLIPVFAHQNLLNHDPGIKSHNGFVGIKNLGCVCYMIATLQQFYCSPVFRYGILMATDGKEFTPSEFKGNVIDDNLFHQFQKMMAYLDISERKEYCPQDFCFSYKDYSGQPTNIMIQQDADEFLKVLLEKLENSLKNSPFAGVLNSVFLGKICNVIKCKSCGFEKTNEENFYNISLEVKKMNNIMESLDKLIEEEIISDYMCDSCKKKCDISKRALLKHLPNSLILSLKKMCFDLELLQNTKIHSRYDFPMNINLQKYMYKPTKKDDNTEENGDIKIETIPEDQCEYKLVGVVLHKGNSEFGHYTSLINANRGDVHRPDIIEDKWFEFDDSKVSPFDLKKFEEECFGIAEENEYVTQMMSSENMISKSAYLLFYEKVKKDKIQFLFNADNIDQKQLVLNHLKNPQDYEFSDNILSTSFYNMKQYIPEVHKTEIEEDNKALILEQQLLSKTFTSAFADIILNVDLSFIPEVQINQFDLNFQNKKIIAEMFLSILPVILVKIYSPAHENPQIGNIVNAIERALSFLSFSKKVKPEWTKSVDSKIADFFKNHCFLKLRDYFHIIVNSTSSALKNALVDLIVKTISITIDNFELEILSPQEEDDITNILSQTSGQLYLTVQSIMNLLTRIDIWSPNNKRMGPIFAILKRLCEESTPVIKQLAENQFFSYIYNLYMNTDASKSLGIEKILAPILGIIRLMYEYEKRNREENDLYEGHLAEFNKFDLIIKAIQEDYKADNHDELKEIVRLFCSKDKTTSDIIIYYCLKNMQNRQETEMVGQLETLRSLLSIADSFSDDRIRNIFGIPRLIEINCKDSANKLTPMFGLGREANLKVSTNEYVSSFGLERGLLQWVWESKENYPKATILMIFYVLDLMIEYDDVFEYIYSIDPPNYITGTFYDWFAPFCEHHLKSASSIGHSPFKSEFEIYYAMLIPEKLSTFKEKVATRVLKEEQTKKTKIMSTGDTPYLSYSFYSIGQETDVDRLVLHSHKPIYIIGRTIENNIIRKSVLKETDSGKLKIKFRISKVLMIESEPCGTSNKVFPVNCLDSNFQINKNMLSMNNPGLFSFFEKPTFLRNLYSSEDEEKHSSDEDTFPQNLTNSIKTKTNQIEEKSNQKEKVGLVFSILVKNTTDEGFFLRLKVKHRNPTGEFTESLLAPIKSLRGENVVYTITNPQFVKNSDKLSVFASYKMETIVLMKEYNSDGFSKWEPFIFEKEQLTCEQN